MSVRHRGATARFLLETHTMTKNQPETPTKPCNPVSLSVTDISDSMPMCHEDVPMLDIDDLVIPEPQANEEPASSCVKSDIFDSMEAIYQDITRLLDRIIQSVTMEAPYEII